MSSSLLVRLKQRKLVQWALAYLAGAWLLLQLLDILAQPFAWPDLVLQATTVLLAIGFFAALVLAWYHGEKGAQRVTGIELLMLAGILTIAGADRPEEAEKVLRELYEVPGASPYLKPLRMTGALH